MYLNPTGHRVGWFFKANFIHQKLHFGVNWNCLWILVEFHLKKRERRENSAKGKTFSFEIQLDITKKTPQGKTTIENEPKCFIQTKQKHFVWSKTFLFCFFSLFWWGKKQQQKSFQIDPKPVVVFSGLATKLKKNQLFAQLWLVLKIKHVLKYFLADQLQKCTYTSKLILPNGLNP